MALGMLAASLIGVSGGGMAAAWRSSSASAGSSAARRRLSSAAASAHRSLGGIISGGSLGSASYLGISVSALVGVSAAAAARHRRPRGARLGVSSWRLARHGAAACRRISSAASSYHGARRRASAA